MFLRSCDVWQPATFWSVKCLGNNKPGADFSQELVSAMYVVYYCETTLQPRACVHQAVLCGIWLWM